ncbi:MAG: hypothetical protein ACR2PL_26440, partial [Dehalococcoidia bacterium]
YESGGRLLARILDQRRQLWEEAERLQAMRQRKTLPAGWPSRYQEPEQPDGSELPKLPEGWVWTNQLSVAGSASLAEPPFISLFTASSGRETSIIEPMRPLNRAATVPTGTESPILPLPPLAEQHRVVATLAWRLAELAELAAAVESGLKLMQELRQAILAQTARGELLPKDSSNEAAEFSSVPVVAEARPSPGEGQRRTRENSDVRPSRLNGRRREKREAVQGQLFEAILPE